MAQGAPAYRRDRPRLSAAQRRPQIIDAATSLIAERGFWGVSMQDIADRCELTVPGLLRHMESKVGLLIAVLEHRDVEDALSLRAYLGATEDELPQDWATGRPAGVDLRRLCAATMRRNATQPEIVRLFTLLAAESLDPAHPAHAYFARRQQLAAAAYTALAERLTDRPEVLARQIMAMMDGLQIQWLRTPETTDLVREWETAAETLFARFTALAAPAAAGPMRSRPPGSCTYLGPRAHSSWALALQLALFCGHPSAYAAVRRLLPAPRCWFTSRRRQGCGDRRVRKRPAR